MMRFTHVVFAIFALMLAGCGHSVYETIDGPQTLSYNTPGAGRTVVVLPFADYSQGDSIASAQRRSMMITERITDKLTANGFFMPVQEDVFQYLVTERIINPLSYSENGSTSLNYELAGDWSNTMKNILTGYLETERNEQMTTASNAPGAHGLTTTAIAKIGRTFKADYVIRGRILEFKASGDKGNWAPWKRGIIPFIMQGGNRIFLGYADSAEYDNWGTDGTFFERQNASHFGHITQATVQMRIWVQDAATGNVIWTNRISVDVEPRSFFSDNRYDTLFNTAIDQGVSSLIDNFISLGL